MPKDIRVLSLSFSAFEFVFIELLLVDGKREARRGNRAVHPNSVHRTLDTPCSGSVSCGCTSVKLSTGDGDGLMLKKKYETICNIVFAGSNYLFFTTR